MSPRKSGAPDAICYYVSGHGLGHASRAAQVIARLPREREVIVKTMAPAAFLRRESGRRDLEVIAQQFDVGAVQRSNLEIDWARTFDEARRVQAEGEAALGAEAEFLHERGVGVVVCDAPPLPLTEAARAGVPGLVVANFTWIEIYGAGGRARRAGMGPLLDAWRHEYAQAILALRTPLGFRMPYFPRVRDIPLIARTGRARREDVRAALGLGAGERVALLYLGTWGGSTQDGSAPRIERLAELEAQGWTFVALDRLPAPVRWLDPEAWSFSDVTASVDAVVTKAGYGTVAECMVNGTPCVFYPRPEFAEWQPLRRAVVAWGGGIEMSREEFLAGHWGHSLERALRLTERGVARRNGQGAQMAADTIVAGAVFRDRR